MKACSMLICVALLASVVTGCGDGEGKVIRVAPGESVQAAVDAAQTNTTIEVLPGVYHESPGAGDAVRITKDGIRLIGLTQGAEKVVLESLPGQENGIVVTPVNGCFAAGARLRNFELRGFAVRGFEDNGVLLDCVDGFVLADNELTDNLEYGLFPIHSTDGLIEGNTAVGSTRDTGIYVGQSSHVTVRNNVAHGNVSGFEIENSTDCIVEDNEAFNNTGGILVFALPGLDVKETARTSVRRNSVHDNNAPNTAPPGAIVASVPSGTGILLLGADETEVRENTVVRNDFFGVGVASYCIAAALMGRGCEGIDIEPDPDGNQIRDNTVTDNGSVPPEGLEVFAADLVWDGSGQNNCWSENTFGTQVPSPLPGCP